MKLISESKESSRLNRSIKKELLAYKAEDIWKEIPISNDLKVIYRHYIDWTIKDLRDFSKSLRRQQNTIILLASTYAGSIRLVCSRSEGLKNVDAGKILTKASKLLGGKGGGSSEMAQGGAPLNDSEIINECLYQSIKDFL